MSFTPPPNTGSTWWAARLRAAGTRAATHRDLLARMTAPKGPLIRPLAPGEAAPFMLSLTPTERAALDERIAPEAPALARAVAVEILDVPVARRGRTATQMSAVVDPASGLVIATTNTSDVYDPARWHDNAADMGGFTEHTIDTATPPTSPARDTADDIDGGVA